MGLLDLIKRTRQTVCATIPGVLTTPESEKTKIAQTVCATIPSVLTTPELEKTKIAQTVCATIPGVLTTRSGIRPIRRSILPPERNRPLEEMYLALPQDARSEAMEKLRFVESVRREKEERNLPTAESACKVIAVRDAEHYPILSRGGHKGASRLTWANYRNWTRDLRDSGATETTQKLTALARRYKFGYDGADWDNGGKFETFRELFLRGYHLQHCLDASKVWRDVRDAMRAKDPSSAIPTPSQLRYYLSKIPAEIGVMEREGEVAWTNKAGYNLTRDWSLIEPNMVIIGDNRDFDSRVRPPEGMGTKGLRPTLAALMDARSWYITSWIISVKPITHEDQIKLLAMHCCATEGAIPQYLYYDNGKDYKTQGFTIPKIIAGKPYSIAQSLGLKVKFALPYNARAKTIEPNFNGLKNEFDKMFADYLGSNPLQRPDSADWGDKHPETLPTLETFVGLFRSFLQKYNATPRYGAIHQGRSPLEIWSERGTAASMPLPQLMDAFRRPLDVRKIASGRSVNINNSRYYTDAAHYGEKVIVKDDLFDSETIYLYNLDGGFITSGRTRGAVKAIVDGDPDATALLKEQLRRKRRLEREVKRLCLELKGGVEPGSEMEMLLSYKYGIDYKKEGETRTVKGKSHVFKRIAPVSDVLALEAGTGSPAPEDTPRLPSSREIQRDAELERAIRRAMTEPDRGSLETSADPEPKMDLSSLNESPLESADDALDDALYNDSTTTTQKERKNEIEIPYDF